MNRFIEHLVLRRKLISVCVVFIGVPCGQAVEATRESPVPTPPLVAAVQPGTRWSMEIQRTDRTAKQEPEQSKSESASGKEPVRLEMAVAADGVRKGIVTYSDQTEHTFYLVKGIVLQQASNSREIIAYAVGDGGPGDFDSLEAKSFPATNWIALKHYKQVTSLAGTDYYKYHANHLKGVELEDGFKLDAWIRVADHHPMQVQLGGVKYVFSEVTPFSDPIPLPPEYDLAFRKLAAQTNALKRMEESNRRRNGNRQPVVR